VNAVRAGVAAILGLVLALTLMEVAVRPIYQLAVAYEPGIGYVNAPGRVRWGGEGFARSTWGAHGERVTPGRRDGASVLVLGDSFTEGLMVGDDEVFPAVAQAALDRDGADLTLHNAGRSTMSAADYVALAARYTELYRPRWTVLELRSNDLAEDAWEAGRTRFVRGEGGALAALAVVTPERTGLSGRFFEARQRSMLLGYGAVRFARFRQAAAAEPPLFEASRTKPAAAGPLVPPVEEELDLLFRAFDGKVTVLFLSEALPEADPLETRARAHCERSGRSCVFTREAFLGLRSSGKDPYGFSNTHLGIGHMNAIGHRAAGELVAEELERRVGGRPSALQ
jgi:hypothetical protein